MKTGTFFFIILVFSHSLPLALTKLEVEPVGLRLLDPEPSGSQAVEMKKKLYEASTGSNFTLYCFAEMTQPIIESTASSFMPKVPDPELLRNLTNDAELCDFSNSSRYSFCTALHVVNATYLDTGKYSCNFGQHHLEESSWKEEMKGDEQHDIHIFVNDPNNLRSSDRYFDFFNVFEHSETFVFPCTPSHPSVKVEIMKPGTTNLTGNRDLSFDPTIGYTMKKVNTSDAGAYICSFSKGNLTTDYHIRLMVLHIPSVPKSSSIPQLPDLELVQDNHRFRMSKAKTVERGSDFLLFCNVTFDIGHVGKISWSREGSNIVPPFTDQPCNEQNVASKCLYSFLNVTNASDTNTGTFVCSVQNHMGQVSNSTVFISIKEKDSQKCNLRHIPRNLSGLMSEDDDKCLPVRVRAGKPVALTMEMEYDQKLQREVIWLAPDGQVYSSFDHGAHGRKSQHMTFYPPTEKSHSAILNITKVDIYDNGTFVFSCPNNSTANIMDSTVQFCVEVLDRPRANIMASNKSFDLVQLGSSYEFECLATGNPQITRISWNICRLEGEMETCWEEAMNLDETLMNGEKKFHVHANITLPVPMDSQTIFCKACNDQNECDVSDRLDFTPIDFYPPKNEVFGICLHMDDGRCTEIEEVATHFQLQRFATERLTVTCAKSVMSNIDFDFHSDLDYPALETSSQYSIQKTMDIEKLSLNDSGYVSCFDKVIKIGVLAISPPVPAGPLFNMNSTKISLKHDEQSRGHVIVLNCSTVGIPKPKITWLKDGHPLPSDLQFYYLDKDHTSVLKLQVSKPSDGGHFSCIAENLAGRLNSFKTIVFGYDTFLLSIFGPSGLTVTIISFALILIAFMVLCVLLCFCRNRHKYLKDEINTRDIYHFLRGDPCSINPGLPLEEQAALLPYDEDIEFPKDRLHLGQVIGSGAFGRVVKAEAIGISDHEPSTIVAVKMPKPPASKSQVVAMMSEIKIMLHIGKHLNVVNLLGACTSDLVKKELLVIVEYCCHGNLQQFLLSRRNRFINQVNPLTGVYDPNFEEMKTANHCHKDAKGLVKVDYADLDVYKSNESISQCPQKKVYQKPRKKISVISTDSAFESRIVNTDMTTASETVQALATLPREGRRQHRLSTRSNDADFDNVITLTDMTQVSGHSHSARRHKISILSTDTQFDHVINTTDTTVLSSAKPSVYDNHGEEEDEEQRLTVATKDLLSWAYQIAKGMEHLASKKIVHGDLAARNVLLARNNVVKICDFGLAKNVYSNPNYQKTSNGPLPIKWMALESLTYRIFSSQSDVWSYGIVLWELFSLAKTPYPELNADETFQKRLESGYRMEKPSFAPDEMYKVMRDCWLSEPGLRPTFTELAEKMGDELQEGEQEHYLNLNRSYEEENKAKEQRYVYIQRHVSCEEDGKAFDGGETSPMLPTNPDFTSDAFSNPAYGKSGPTVGLKRKRKPRSRSLLLYQHVDETGHSSTSNLSEHEVAMVKFISHDHSEPRPPLSQSVSSVSSGFHSVSSDRLHRLMSTNSARCKSKIGKAKPLEMSLVKSSSIEVADLHDQLTPPPSYAAAVHDHETTSFIQLN